MKKVTLKIESLNEKILALYTRFLVKMLSINNIKMKVVHLPCKIKRITFLKSPHVFKKSKEHFELRKNKTLLICCLKNLKPFKTFLLNRPNTIKVKVTYQKRKIA